MDTPDNIPCPFTSDWPIHPTFLSKASLNGEYYSPNRDGIYDSDTLRGFLADSSDDAGINNPLSLFQVVPTSCEFIIRKSKCSRVSKRKVHFTKRSV